MSIPGRNFFNKPVLRWIFLAVLLQWHLTSSQSLFSSTHSLQNSYLQGFAFQVLTGITSYFECYMKCQDLEYCHSINYYPSKDVCELNSVTHETHPHYMVQGDAHATYLMDSLKPPPGQQDTGLLAQNCSFLKRWFPHLPSGSYWLDLDMSGPQAPFRSYCDMETDGGGWTLVWAFTFHKYSDYQNFGNFVRPVPKNLYKSADAPISDTPPQSEINFNAMNFDLWKLIGKDFLIKSNINNWVSCVPGTGSLVTKTLGSLNCKFIKQIVTDQPSCREVPGEFQKWNNGYGLTGSTGKLLYYFDKSSSGGWPVHDPCAKTKPNHKKNVQNPHTNVYIR